MFYRMHPGYARAFQENLTAHTPVTPPAGAPRPRRRDSEELECLKTWR